MRKAKTETSFHVDTCRPVAQPIDDRGVVGSARLNERSAGPLGYSARYAKEADWSYQKVIRHA